MMDMGTEEVWVSDPFEEVGCTKKGTESCTHARLHDLDEIRDVTVTKIPFIFMPADTIMDTCSRYPRVPTLLPYSRIQLFLF